MEYACACTDTFCIVYLASVDGIQKENIIDSAHSFLKLLFIVPIIPEFLVQADIANTLNSSGSSAHAQTPLLPERGHNDSLAINTTTTSISLFEKVALNILIVPVVCLFKTENFK